MRNVQDIVSNGRCIGCCACFDVCPKGYIYFEEDGGMGFPVPHVKDCDGCEGCLMVCPTNGIYEENDSEDADE